MTGLMARVGTGERRAEFMVSRPLPSIKTWTDLVYNSSPSTLSSHVVVMSIWESIPPVISAGACLVTALIFATTAWWPTVSLSTAPDA